jgi:hypothetical protein
MPVKKELGQNLKSLAAQAWKFFLNQVWLRVPYKATVARELPISDLEIKICEHG